MPFVAHVPVVFISDMIISFSELLGDAVLGDEAGVVRALSVEGVLVGVPAHGGRQHLAEERAVPRRLRLRARHHRIRDVAKQLSSASSHLEHFTISFMWKMPSINSEISKRFLISTAIFVVEAL